MKKQTEYDTISLKEAHELLLMKQREHILSSFTFPTKPGKDGYYFIWVPDPVKKSGRRHLAAKSVDALKDKVYDFVTHAPELKVSRKFNEVFEAANDSQLDLITKESASLSKKNTILRNRSEYKRYFSETDFENYFIDDITAQDIKDIVTYNLRRYKMKRKALSSLKAIINLTFIYAMDMGWLNANPNITVDYKKFSGMLVDDTPISQRVHSEDELMAILTECHEKQEKRPTYFPAYALELQILLGMRRGEVPPLLWSDVSDNSLFIHREQLTVKKDKDTPEHFAIVEHTKTHVNREYPMTEDLKDFLTRLKAAHDRLPASQKSDFLFPAKSELGCITNNTVYNFYRRLCQKLNIQISQDCIKGTHSFRRNAITDTLALNGGDAVQAALIYGNSPQVIFSNYLTGTDMNKAKEVLNKRNLLNTQTTNKTD